MQQIKAAGDKVTLLIIKGHASGDGIQVGTGSDWLTCESGVIHLMDTDVTALLKSITDGSSTIRLRGCFSHALAKRMEDAGVGGHVYGAVRFVIGIPGTAWGMGVYQ